MINDLIDSKLKLEDRINENVPLLIIWDSIASTPSSKDEISDNPNETIGFKARELTFEMNKIKPLLAVNRITSLFIDQVRSNLKIDSPYARAEKTVGDFGNFKSATSVTSLQHNIKQWLFLSRGKLLSKTDPLQVDGWVMHVFTEKNKLAPSNYWVEVVFDKKFGIIPILSEYYFLSNLTKTESKLYKTKKQPFSLPISGKQTKKLTVVDPTTGSVLYESDNFRERNFLNKYNTDQTFASWFDKALEISIDERIKNGYFRMELNDSYQQKEDETENEEINIAVENTVEIENSIEEEDTGVGRVEISY